MGGGYHPLSEVFLIFFLDDKTSASDVLSSYLFIPARFEDKFSDGRSNRLLMMVSHYGYGV